MRRCKLGGGLKFFVNRVAWRFVSVILLNRRAHRLRMTFGCGPLKTAPFVCHRSMFKVSSTFCNVTAVVAVYT